MKHSKEFENFTNLVDRVVVVPHSAVQRRLEEERARADQNPRKRGPKKKTKKSSASGRGSNDRA